MVSRAPENPPPVPARRRGLRLWQFACGLPVVAGLLVVYRLTAPLGGRVQAAMAAFTIYMLAVPVLLAGPAGWVGDRLGARARGRWTRRGGRADVAAGLGTLVEAATTAGLLMAGGLVALRIGMIVLESVSWWVIP